MGVGQENHIDDSVIQSIVKSLGHMWISPAGTQYHFDTLAVLGYNALMSVHRVLFSLMALLLVGCSSPLLPAPDLPVPARQSQGDVDVVMRLRTAWNELAKADLSERERALALQEYNSALLVLVQRLRHDAHAKGELPHYDSFEMLYESSDSTRRFLGLHQDIVPSCEVELSALNERYTLPGIGVPMVGVIPADKVREADEHLHNISSRGMVSALTAVMIFPKDGGKPQFRLVRRLSEESITVGMLKYPLAADWSALLEVYWNLTRVKEDRLLGLLRPQELRNTTGLSSIQAYDPNKIPVILTHGLASSAGTFDNLVNRLYADPEIRRNYQFWYFNYPTGVAWTVSARVYRESIQQLRNRVDPKHENPNWDKMVVLGHSMGGLITHYSQCEEPWNLLWASDIPKEQLKAFLKPKYRDVPFPDPALEALRKDYFFYPVKAGLVIYLATPHRGAPVARYRLATLLTKLVTLPQTLLKEAYNVATLQEDMLLLNPQDAYLWFTSVSQLRPNSYSITGLQGLKVRNVPTHSIIGDRGKGNCPKCSDGVVPYWSSHISWGTETVVPADHSVQDSMEAANDLKQVLGAYAEKYPARVMSKSHRLRALQR